MANMVGVDRTPKAHGSGNSKTTPLVKTKAKTPGTSLPKAPQTPLTKALGSLSKIRTTPVTKPTTPVTQKHVQGATLAEADAQVGRTRRKRGGTHMERDGASGFISSSVMTMFMCGSWSQNK